MIKQLQFRLMVLAVLLSGTAMWGQTFYDMSTGNYSQDFANISGWANNYTSGTGAANWKVAANATNSSVNNTTVFSTSTGGGVQKGSGNMILLATGTNSAATDLLLNFTGRTAGTISLDWAKVVNSANSQPRTTDFKIQYSVNNGSSFTDLTGYTIPRVFNNNDAESGSFTNIALPAEISNKAQVVIRFYIWTNGNTTGSGNRPKLSIDNIVVTSTPVTTDPTITVAPTALSGYTYEEGNGPSAQQSFTVSGINLTNNISIAATTNYEISSTSGSGFSSSAITLTPTSGTVANTTIYVRLKAGLSAGNYNGEVINITSTGATTKTVALWGAVTPPVISAALAGTLGEVALTAGSATATVTLTNDTYAASLSTSGFTLNNAPAGLTLTSVDRTSNTVATLHFAFTGDIDSNVTNFNVTVATSQLTTSAEAVTTGNLIITAVNEVLTTTPTSITSGLNYVVGNGPSAAQSFTVNNSTTLQAGGGILTVTAPSNFEVSTTSATTGFGATAELTYTGTGTVSPNQVWVRLKSGLSVGAYTQSVTVAGGKASASVSVTGNVIVPPPANDSCSGAIALMVNGASVQGTLQNATSSGVAASCGGNADDDVWYSFTTTTAGVYKITADGGEDVDLVIDLRSGACTGTNIECVDSTAGGEEVIETALNAGTTYYIRVYDYFALASLTAYTFDIKVQKLQDSPVANEAEDVTIDSFIASWEPVDGAESYKLYVATSSGTGTAAEWNFPNNPDDNIVDIANANNAGRTITTNATGTPISYTPVQSSSTSAMSLAGWQSGNGTKYWEVEVNTTGLSELTLTSAQRSSNTGPRDFKVQYKIGAGGEWTDVPGATVTVANNWNATIATALPSACDNKPSVLVRWIMTSNISVNGGSNQVQSTGTSAIDNVSIKGNTYIAGYNPMAVSGTTHTVTGLNHDTDYYYTVKAVATGAPDSEASNEIHTKTGLVNTWNGTEWSAGRLPAIIDNAIITGDYVTADEGGFSANLVTVQSDTLRVSPNTLLRVRRGITLEGASGLVVMSNGNLIQERNDAANSGTFIVYRNTTPLKRFDYVLWSSPVGGQVMVDFSPLTDVNRFYSYATQTNNYSQISNSTAFAIGSGYLIRVPWDHPTVPAIFSGKFEGTLTNGMQNVALALNNDNPANSYNAVGNPYASPVDADAFIDANAGNIDGTLWFWRKTNGAPTDSYVTYNRIMGGNSTNEDVLEPNGIIQVGQGFIVNATNTNLTFDNSVRVSNFDNQFYRNGNQAANETPERHRIWINLTNAEGAFSQALVGYAAGATNGVDTGIDSKYLATNNASFFSVINGDKYALQGRALPFSTSDVIPMGYKTIAAGTYSLTLDHVDGLFLTTGQPIYIKDNVTQTVHNLLDGSYTFASGTGTFLDRFEIIFANEALGTNNPVLNPDSVVVYKEGNAVKVNTGTAEIAEVAVFDMRGRLIASQKNVNSSEATINNIAVQQQVLVVQVKTAQNGTVSKKIIF